jgi:hypothetical protein
MRWPRAIVGGMETPATVRTIVGMKTPATIKAITTGSRR